MIQKSSDERNFFHRYTIDVVAKDTGKPYISPITKSLIQFPISKIFCGFEGLLSILCKILKYAIIEKRNAKNCQRTKTIIMKVKNSFNVIRFNLHKRINYVSFKFSQGVY